MREARSLLSLCVEEAKCQLIRGNDDLQLGIYELPSDLFDILLTRLPPLALQKLEAEMPFDNWNDHESTDDYFLNGRKRKRDGNFNAAWRACYKSRWPELFHQIKHDDWQQIYWETHLQNCLDEAAEVASLPSFDGCIGEIKIPDTVLKCIGYEGPMNSRRCAYTKLSYHCQQFGSHARCLRLQNVLLSAEICHLFRNSKLQGLVLRWIRSKEHVDGLCKLLNQNTETLTSLEFIHSKLSSEFLDAICASLRIKSMQTHGIQHFSINTSSLLETDPVFLPVELVSFLSSGRSLCSLKFSDSHLGQNFAKAVFCTLLDDSSSLSILDLSDNNIAGWLSNFNQSFPSASLSFGTGKSLQSLRVLNLRGNNLCKDDANSLRYALVHMPNLEILEISDNPIEDDGIRSLIPYFVEASERYSPLAELNLENCELSCNGVTQLLNALSTLKKPLNALSIADNSLGSQVAAAVGKFLVTSIQVLNIGGIGLGSSGFQELQGQIMQDLKLVEINLSKNRGGIETAKFLSKLIPRAPELVAVSAAYNLMPVESLSIICSALKVAKGNLERLDLTGNIWDLQPVHASALADFQFNGKPIMIIPSAAAPDVPYDDDP